MTSNTDSGEEISFESAIEKIDAIIRKIQAGKSLDSLVEDVRAAKALIDMCEARISWTEGELAKMLGEDAQTDEEPF